MKLRVSRQMHDDLKFVAKANGMQCAEIVRRSLRAHWKSRVVVPFFWEPATRDNSTVLTLGIPEHLLTGLEHADVVAVLGTSLETAKTAIASRPLHPSRFQTA